MPTPQRSVSNDGAIATAAVGGKSGALERTRRAR